MRGRIFYGNGGGTDTTTYGQEWDPSQFEYHPDKPENKPKDKPNNK